MRCRLWWTRTTTGGPRLRSTRCRSGHCRLGGPHVSQLARVVPPACGSASGPAARGGRLLLDHHHHSRRHEDRWWWSRRKCGGAVQTPRVQAAAVSAHVKRRDVGQQAHQGLAEPRVAAAGSVATAAAATDATAAGTAATSGSSAATTTTTTTTTARELLRQAFTSQVCGGIVDTLRSLASWQQLSLPACSQSQLQSQSSSPMLAQWA